ncbi:MAG: HEAT repeat domain-containing protein [Leptolyngbyaceae cyanobacterium MAG.088]|nr:HEAT repeat domain-containing protein [Leptolyngbyaceae cyanobacterium MAG.088]
MPPSRCLSGVEPSNLQNRVDHWQRFKTGDFKQKWNSSKLIVKEGDSAIAPLLELLDDPTADAETHWFTIRALGNFPGEPEVIAALATQVNNDASCYANRTSEQAAELSAFVIETLAAMGTSAIDVLSQLLEDPQRRLLAAKALNRVRSSGIIPAMVRVANDNDAMVRYYAVDALGSFHSSTVTPVLLAALKDLSAAVRKVAVMALGRRRDLQESYQLSQQLQPLLWDIDVAVSCQAALALGRLGADDTITSLKSVLLSEHTPMALRIDTVRALGWYCDFASVHGQTTTANGTVNKAFTVLTDTLTCCRDGDANTQNAPQGLTAQERAKLQITIIRVLGDLRRSLLANQATDVLIHHLEEQLPISVIQVLIMALANLKQPQAFDALMPLLNHPAETIPIHAIAALKQLDPEDNLSRVTDYINGLSDDLTDILNFW